MTTVGTEALDFIAAFYPKLEFILAQDLEARRIVVGALGIVIGDWWTNEGVDCPETSKHAVCSSFFKILGGDILSH